MTNILQTTEEIKQLKSTQFIKMLCPICSNTFDKVKKEYTRCIKELPTYVFYCSRKCYQQPKKKLQTVACDYCKKPFTKKNSELKRTNLNFCSRSCLGYYTNANKVSGKTRSKLELRLEEQLKKDFTLDIVYSDRVALKGLELDIYIPDIKIAFEIQGIFHYQPIFGKEKLNSIQERDDRKRKLCSELGIKLIPINVSMYTYITKERFDCIYRHILKVLSEKGIEPTLCFRV